MTLVVVEAPVGAAPQANLGGAPGSCDKPCLTSMADGYLAALAAHDRSRAALAPGARVTENAQVIPVGGGLWKTASEAPLAFKIYVPDPVAGQIGGIVLMREAGKPVQLALRLKVVDRQITEAEHIVARNVNEANFLAPRPALLATVPPAERIPRGLMLVVGHSYYDALEQSDGSVAPFADDCVRRENGTQTAGPRPAGPAPGGRRGGASGSPTAGSASAAAQAPAPRAGGPGPGLAQTCAAQIDSRVFYYINSIDLRRVWIADEERGLVFGLSMFRHPMEEKIFTVFGPDGTRTQRDMTRQSPFDFLSVHIFKIRRGQIHDIEAMGISLPFRSTNGWSEFWR